MRVIFITAFILGLSIEATAQMSADGLSDNDKAAWQEAQDDGLDAPRNLDDLAYCAVIWEDWRADLQKSGKGSTMPEYLDMSSAKTHAWAYSEIYEMTQDQEFPEWPGTAQTFGPYLTAVSDVSDEKKDYRSEYFWGLSWCYRDDLFEKSRA